MENYKIKKSTDGTIKIEFEEGYISVIIPTKNDKISVCVSCQIGCPVGCKFCHTGKIGLKRNLSADEIVNQVDVAKNILDKNPTSVVYMGMGEPTLNLENVKKSGEIIHKKYSISKNRITISTSCLKNLNILEGVDFNIALSVHSPFDEIRKKLIPGATDLYEIVEFCKKYLSSGNNKKYVMIEYALVKGVNDSKDDLQKLLSFDWPKKIMFNLIEFNDIDKMEGSDFMVLEYFKEEIIRKGWKCFIRSSRGKDIGASCGMLNFIN